MNAVPRLAWAAWIAVCIIWGTTYLAIRICLETVPPALMAGLRWTVAGLLVAAIMKARGERVPAPGAWPGLLLLAILMIGFGNGFVVWAEQVVPSGPTAVIVATSPFWMVAIEAWLPRGERLSAGTVLGLTIGFAGILLLVWPDLRQGGGRGADFLLGVGALQLACLGWALGSSFSRRHGSADDVIGSTMVQMLLGGLLMLAIGSAAGEWSRFSLTSRTAGALLYLTVVGSVGGFVAYMYALRHIPVSTVSLYAYINPVIAVLLGALLLGEPLSARIAIAAAFVLAGLAVVRSMTERRSTATGGRTRAAAFEPDRQSPMERA